LLRSLIGSTITNLVRYSFWPGELASEQLGVPAEMVLSLTLGPVLMYLDDCRVIGFGDNPPLKSVTVWLERDASGNDLKLTDLGDKFPLAASDHRFASEFIREMLGKKIVRVRILKRRSQQTIRPYEVAILFECEGDRRFLLAHGIYDDLNSFTVIQPEQIMEMIRPELYELEVLETPCSQC
jgi:hypothetical protein